MAREVTHPNVVRVYDIGRLADGELFISMEFIDGEDLASSHGSILVMAALMMGVFLVRTTL